MKKALILLASLTLISCSSVQNGTDSALGQVKGNASVGFGTTKVEGGYEVNGHASTNIFGVEPYGSFKTGIRYAPRKPVEQLPEVVVIATK
jgi:hypothetical protein